MKTFFHLILPQWKTKFYMPGNLIKKTLLIQTKIKEKETLLLKKSKKILVTLIKDK